MLRTAVILLGKRPDADLHTCVVGGGQRMAVLGQNMKSVGQQSGRHVIGQSTFREKQPSTHETQPLHLYISQIN